ncbi:MAG: hypothetical protein K5778_04285 [Bacteroidaceae bacterium]|nr:hypothetical protein [Bacteroidaceae bacterium]
MKPKYTVPTVHQTTVEARGMFFENISFPVGTDPHGGWSDAKVRDQQMPDTEDPWQKGLW